MGAKRKILIILLIVVVLALVIEFIRLDFFTKLSTSGNIDLINVEQAMAVQLKKDDRLSERYLIIYDQGEAFIQVKENIEKVLDYTKISHDAVLVNEVNSINSDYQAVILIMEDLDKLDNVEDLMKYIFEGGNLFVAFRLAGGANFNNIYRKMGINEFNDFKTARGIRLLDNVLIKGRGLEIKATDFFNNSSLSLQLSKDCQQYAESMDGIKLLWKKDYGRGNIIYFNGSTLGDKKNRGLILGSFSLLDDDFIYPIISSKVNFIDDFPAPIPEGRNETIFNEFGRTIPRFYKDIWWPNMLELAARYNIKYSGVIIGTYNDETEKIDSESIDLDMRDLKYFGREIFSQGGEIGIHGYNHQPLATQPLADENLGYHSWQDSGVMVDSLKKITSLAKEAFPNYNPQLYVPPSNILFPEGREAILAAGAGIKIISSLYSKVDGDDAYEQEFAIADDGLIEFPRLTAGYEYTDDSVWTMLNGITMYGLFSHFVHPDDILDINRTHGKGWTKLLKEFDKLQKIVFDNFAWLKGMTASEGANEMIKYLLIDPVYEKQETYLQVNMNNLFDGTSFVLRSKKEIGSVINASVQEIDQNVYLIQSSSPVFQINFKR